MMGNMRTNSLLSSSRCRPGTRSVVRLPSTAARGLVRGPEPVVSRQDAFDRIIASLHEAMLDDTKWRETSALIDDACGLVGNHL